MKNFKRVKQNAVSFEIDTAVYNDTVITKAFYWLSGDFYISQENQGKMLHVILEKKEGNIHETELAVLRTKLNQDLIDFKTRDIVNRETKNIREILLIKAFSNNDDFEDFNLLANNE